MRLVLHIGTHRTGTTSIQRFAASHRQALRRRGLWYPGYDLIGVRPHYAHLDLAHGMAGEETPRVDYDGAHRFFEEVRRRARDDETVLISAEPMYRHTHPTVAETSSEYWERRNGYVGRVRDIVGAHGTEVVVVLRRQDGFAQSLYNEHVKTTRYHGSFAKFLRDKAPYFRYDRQLDLWKRHFPSLQALVWEDLLIDRSLPRAFFETLGVSIEGLNPVDTQNTSLAPELIEYKRQLNGSRLSRAQLRDVVAHMSGKGFHSRAKLDGQKKHWAPPQDLEAFLESFEECNAHVLREHTTLARDSLFPDMAVADRPTYEGLTAAQWRDITAALLDTGMPAE